MSKNQNVIDTVSTYATYILFAELGLGAALHAMRIPLTGYLLSLNQIFILTKASAASHPDSRFHPSSISTLAALLKSMAPMGKKITPMLAIAMQGYLYNLGILVFGHTLPGQILGGALSSLWGFAQPLILYYFIFGSSIYESIFHSVQHLQKALGVSFPAVECTLAFFIFLKFLFATCLVLSAHFLPQTAFEQYLAHVSKMTKRLNSSSPSLSLREIAKKAFFDLLHPFFLLSVIFTAVFLYSENTFYWVINGIIRPFGLGFICFFILRWITGEKVITFFQTNKAFVISQKLKKTIENLQKE